MKRYAPTMTAFQQAKARVANIEKFRERQAKEFEARSHEMKKLALTDGGEFLLQSMDTEFQVALFEWLRGDPQDVGLSIRCHTKLNQLLAWKARIQPEESKDE